MIRQRPKGQQDRTPKASRWGRRSALPPREKVTLTIKYRGGPECWYEVQARGEMGRFHGMTSIHDVVQEVAQGAEWYTRNRR